MPNSLLPQGSAAECHEQSQELLPTQDRAPKVMENIDRVGISGLKAALTLASHGAEPSHFLANIELYIDLDMQRKGIHMSRLVESINEKIVRASQEPNESFEQIGVEILSELQKRHRYHKGEISFQTTLLLRRYTPVTAKPTDEPYDVLVKVSLNNGIFRKFLEVKVVGSTLCPHSLETTKGKAHVQRAEAVLSIETPISENIVLEELVEICEKSFSSPTFTVLKTVDEAAVVEKMFQNPKFVEDVARDCLRQARNLEFKGRLKISVRSLESIHKHDAVSEIERVFQ